MESDVRGAPAMTNRERNKELKAAVDALGAGNVVIGEINPFSGAPRSVEYKVATDKASIAAAKAYLATLAKVLNPGCGTNTHYVSDGEIQRTSTGCSVAHFRQYYLGVPVFDGLRSVHFDARGAITDVVGDTLPVPDETSVVPLVRAQDAVLISCDYCREQDIASRKRSKKRSRMKALRFSARRPAVLSAALLLPSRPTVLRKPPCVEPVTAELTIFYDGNDARLAWVVAMVLPERRGRYELIVPADRPDDRSVMFCRRTSAHAQGEATVYEFNPGEAALATRTLPRPAAEYPDLGRPLPAGFPREWVDATETRGNNVEGKGKGGKTTRGVRVGNLVRFAPSNQMDQAIVNAFYLCNFAHDFYELLGFDEAAGNFQKTNFSGGGLGGDPLEVWVFDGDNQAAMENRVDGKQARLVLGRWSGRYAALDADIVIHEYTHGVSERLIGGRNTAHPLRHGEQSKALGEGYSDYFALSIQNYYRRAGGSVERNAFGAWVGNNAARGIRRHAYSDPFPATYKLLGRPEYSDAHDAGQVWAYALIRISRALGALLNDRNAGDSLCWQTVLDSFKLLRVGSDGPHFLDARDAFLKALAQTSNRAPFQPRAADIRTEALACFAALGMGPKAKSPSANYSGIVTDFGV